MVGGVIGGDGICRWCVPGVVWMRFVGGELVELWGLLFLVLSSFIGTVIGEDG